MIDFKEKYGPWAMVAGASEGLGAAFAEELAKRGLNLILIARRREKLELLAIKLRKEYSVEINCYPLDLSDYQETKSVILKADFNIGLLVYNAAYAPISYFEGISEEDLSKIVDVNIKTPLLLTKMLSAKMIEKGRGGIVLMSSLAGTQGSPKIATYAASKAFNMILAEGLWHELKKYGIDVLASCAGAVRTPGYKNAQDEKDAPGTMDAEAVAHNTLNALGKGPITVPGFTNKMVRFLMGRILPRKLAIAIMHKNTKNLS
ncbi:MAG: short-chain dehydrogenase [Marinilabiliales bacterium]|nr:MAG: short-chain dehydrogenase [Marinilabiliales bacterium]